MELIPKGGYKLTDYHPESLLGNRDLSYNEMIALNIANWLGGSGQGFLTQGSGKSRGLGGVIKAAAEHIKHRKLLKFSL